MTHDGWYATEQRNQSKSKSKISGFYYFLLNINRQLAERLECSPMARKTEVQSPGRVTPKTQKLVLNAALFYTQHYKVWIKGKVEESSIKE